MPLKSSKGTEALHGRQLTYISTWHYGVVYQMAVTEPGGASTDEFLLRVQQAAAGPPWHVDDPPLVCIHVFFI